jgi:hypothetical protein
MDLLSAEEREILERVERLGPEKLKTDLALTAKLNHVLERMRELRRGLQQRLDAHDEYVALDSLRGLCIE